MSDIEPTTETTFETEVTHFKQFIEQKYDPAKADEVDGTRHRALGAVFSIVPVDEIIFDIYDDQSDENEDLESFHVVDFRWRGNVVTTTYAATNRRTGSAVLWHCIGDDFCQPVEDPSVAVGLMRGATQSAEALLASPNFQPIES